MDSEQFTVLMIVAAGCFAAGFIVGRIEGKYSEKKAFLAATNVFISVESAMRKQLIQGTDILRRLLWGYKDATMSQPRNYDLCDEAEKFLKERFPENSKNENSTRKI